VSGEYEAVWAELDVRLRTVIGLLGTSFDTAFALELVEHNEFGVAFEVLRDGLIETQTPVSNETVDALVAIARMMEIDAREAMLARHTVS
jgi:hypothetical protein